MIDTIVDLVTREKCMHDILGWICLVGKFLKKDISKGTIFTDHHSILCNVLPFKWTLNCYAEKG